MPDQSDIDAINESIASGAQKPQSATVDGNSVAQVSVADKILAEQHLQGQQATAANRPGFGLRFQQITPVYR